MQANKRTQIRFTKAPNSVLGTRISLERNTVLKHNNRGLLHKTVNFPKNRLVGDVPSVKSKLHSLQPKSIAGKSALFVAKTGTATVGTALKVTSVATKTALIAENTLFITTDALRRKNRLQLRFERVQKPNGKFKTKAVFDFADKPRPIQRGVLHKVYGLKNCVVGDVPTLKSMRPKSFKGKTALFVAKAGVATTSKAVKVTTKTALKAENGLLKVNDVTKRATILAIERKVYSLKNSNDMMHGVFTVGGATKDIAKLPKNTFLAVRQYLQAKKTYNLTQKSIKSLKKDNKKIFVESKKDYVQRKKKYKKHKKSFLNSSKTKTQKLLIKERKKVFKNQKNDYKQLKEYTKTAKKSFKKEKRAGKRIVRKQRKMIAMPITDLTIKKPIRSGWYKITTADENNDFIKAADKTITAYRQFKKTPQAKLLRARRKSTKFHNRSSRIEGKLKSRNAILKSKKYKKKHKRPIKKIKKLYQKKSLPELVKNATKTVVRAVSSARPSSLATKMLIVILVIFLLIAYPIGFSCAVVLSSTPTITSSVLGTYPVLDKDMAQAESYYTKLAWDYNQKVRMCGNVDTWRYGLRAFSFADSGYVEEPEEFVFGTSYRFPYEPNFDYDEKTLISFLSAYMYDADAGDIEYWEYNNIVKNVLENLFEMQYAFEHYYDNTSHWEELYNYNFYGGGDTNAYYTVYSNESYHNKFKVKSIPSELWKYADSDGYIHFNDNLEVLNAKKGNKRTGWFIQDQRYIITDPSGNSHKPFFYYNSSGNEFYWLYNGHKNTRDYWGWSETDQAWWLVPPGDTSLWNSQLQNTCLVSFYQKNIWVENCKLFYTVRSKRTLDEACKYILSKRDNANERLAYYQYLKEGSEKNPCLNGGHQCLRSPLGGGFESMEKLIYNHYGWDIQTWNEVHCSVEKHNGVDYICSPGSNVYSMIDGIITEIDTAEHMVTVKTKDNIFLWSKEQSVEVTYYNVDVANYQVGNYIKAGNRIGYSTSHTICDGEPNEDSRKYFIHVTMKIGGNVDSHFLIT